jgi:hypothetical protein
MSVESLLSKANENKIERRKAPALFYLKPPSPGWPKANPSLSANLYNARFIGRFCFEALPSLLEQGGEGPYLQPGTNSEPIL